MKEREKNGSRYFKLLDLHLVHIFFGQSDKLHIYSKCPSRSTSHMW